MRQSAEQMAVVVKGVRYGPASSLNVDERMDEVFKSAMFVDPVDKFQRKTNLPKPSATSSIGPSALVLFQPYCAATAYVGR